MLLVHKEYQLRRRDILNKVKYQYNVEELIERFDLLVIDESSLFLKLS